MKHVHGSGWIIALALCLALSLCACTKPDPPDAAESDTAVVPEDTTISLPKVDF